MNVDKYTTQELREELKQYRAELQSVEQMDGRTKLARWTKFWARAIIMRDEAELARRGEAV
jgi:hypothetical protein